MWACLPFILEITIHLIQEYCFRHGGLEHAQSSLTFATPWTVANQAPLSTGFPKQEYWSGLPLPSPGEYSWLREWTHVSCIGRWIFYLWVIQTFLGELLEFDMKYTLKVLVAQSCLTLCDPWTIACQTPLSMEFSKQEYCSGLPFHSPGDLPDPGIEPRSPALLVAPFL